MHVYFIWADCDKLYILSYFPLKHWSNIWSIQQSGKEYSRGLFLIEIYGSFGPLFQTGTGVPGPYIPGSWSISRIIINPSILLASIAIPHSLGMISIWIYWNPVNWLTWDDLGMNWSRMNLIIYNRNVLWWRRRWRLCIVIDDYWLRSRSHDFLFLFPIRV